MYELIAVYDHEYEHPKVRVVLEEALGCPECGANRGMLSAMSENRVVPRFLIACKECKYQGPFSSSLEGAVKQWNKPLSFFTLIKKRRERRRLKRELVKQLEVTQKPYVTRRYIPVSPIITSDS
jgi:hypothetical protein